MLSHTNTELSGILGRSPAFPKLTLQRFMSGVFQVRMETSTRDCILFLEHLIPFLTYWKSFVFELSLSALPKRWSPVLPVGEKGYVRPRGKEQLFLAPSAYTPDIVRRMKGAANYYNEIAARWPTTRFYVYTIPSKQTVFVKTFAWPDIPARLLLGCDDFNQFRALLSPNIAYDWFGSTYSPDQALSFYYNTDHHLKMPGSYDAYRQLHRLISSKKADIGKAIQCKDCFVVPSLTFRGSCSRLSGGYKAFTDNLIDCSLELPPYTSLIHGAKQGQGRNKRSEYATGKIPKERYASHHTEYFGKDHGLIEYKVDKILEKRKLLIIGDSNDNSIEPLLAAHFSRSYFVDLRHFTKDTGHRFHLDTFISQNGIEDVLFIGSDWTTILMDLSAGQLDKDRAN
jgi:hypothetical protein